MKFVENYSELLKYKPHTLRGRIRNSVLDIAGFLFPNTEAASLLSQNRIQFLYIHHIFKDEEEQLRQLLKHLSVHHQFISYSTAVEKILTNSIDAPYVSISSDDGLKNNLSAGTILKEFGVSACFFICPTMIGEKNEEKIKAFTNDRLHFPPVEFLDWKDVDELIKQGHEIGGHTMTHANMANCEGEMLDYEIRECYHELSNRFANELHFAYPYGRHFHFSEAAKKIVFDSGFSSCASAERGCHITNKPMLKQELLIRRDHIILSWPWSHIQYFLANNVRKATEKGNEFPTYAGSHSNK